MSLYTMMQRGALLWTNTSTDATAPPVECVCISSERSSSPAAVSSSSSSSSASDYTSDFVPSRTANDRRSEYSQSRSPSLTSSVSSRSQSSADESDFRYRRADDDDDDSAERSADDSDGEFTFESSAHEDAFDSSASASASTDSKSASPYSVSSSYLLPPSPLVAAAPVEVSDTAALPSLLPSRGEVLRCERILQSGHVFTLHTIDAPPAPPYVSSRKIVVFLIGRCLYGCEYRVGQYKYRQPIVALPLDDVRSMIVYLGNGTPALANAQSGIAEASFALRVRSSAPAKLIAFSRSPFVHSGDDDAGDFMFELSAPSVGDMKYWLRTLHTVLANSLALRVNESLFYRQHTAAADVDVDRAIRRIRFGRADAARVRNIEERTARVDAEDRMKHDRRADEPRFNRHSRGKSLTVETGKHSAVDAAALKEHNAITLGRTSLYPNSLELNIQRTIHVSHSTPLFVNMR